MGIVRFTNYPRRDFYISILTASNFMATLNDHMRGTFWHMSGLEL